MTSELPQSTTLGSLDEAIASAKVDPTLKGVYQSLKAHYPGDSLLAARITCEIEAEAGMHQEPLLLPHLLTVVRDVYTAEMPLSALPGIIYDQRVRRIGPTW
jgi:hypothetical protein